MERKLAEFRARRRADMEARKGEASAAGGCPPPAEQIAEGAADPPGSDEPPKMAEEKRTGTSSSHSRDCKDWLLDTSLGRRLASRQLALTNLLLLKVLLWLVLLGLFVELEFGLPYFVLSLFYWLYEGLRSPEPRKPGELSAYSVFNPDCQPLLGSLTAEQLEGEMGYRPLANR